MNDKKKTASKAAKKAPAAKAKAAEVKKTPVTKGKAAETKKAPVKGKVPAKGGTRGGASPTNAKKAPAKKLKLLQTVSEVDPFVTTGGMGQVAGALTKAIAESYKDIDVRVIAPLYMGFRARWEPEMKFIGEVNVRLAWRELYCGVFELKRDGITFYFVDNRHYFDRENVYGYFDDGERFAFLSKAVFAVMELTKFIPDVIHAHDWQTALVPIYLKTQFMGVYPDMKSVFTIHNIEYQGKFSRDILTDVFGLWEGDAGIVEYDYSINLMKGAVVSCDKLTTVSSSYATEIMHGGGFGLDGIIRENEYKLYGIVNGIDIDLYNPKTDPALDVNYDVKSVKLKAKNKAYLQEYFRLPKDPRKMLICMITRLVSHKGLDLVTCVMEELLKLDVQFLMLGTGDQDYELFFEDMALNNPEKVGVNIAYNPEIASKIYAGADVMLMPSRCEPCGLAQMIACRYGTIPIVRKVGGLGDTIKDCRSGEGNGFVFEEYSAKALFDTIEQAHVLYSYKTDDWKNLVREAMEFDFSWKKSAQIYVDLFKELKG